MTAAVLARLRTTAIPVGDARMPTGAGWQGGAGQSPFVTYLVLYPINSLRQGPEAPLSDRNAAPQWGYQVTSVGRDRRSAETASDIAAAALLAGPPLDLGDGRSPVQLIHTSTAGVDVDESVSPPLFLGVDRYRLDT